MLAESDSSPPLGCSTPFCLRWSFKEDMMSFIICCTLSGPHGGGLGNFLVQIPDGRGPQFLHSMSGTLPAGWQVCPPQGPALGGPASNCNRLSSPLLSTPDSAAYMNIH